MAQDALNGDAHVARTEFGQHRSVDKLNERMNPRIGMDDYVDVFEIDPEQPLRADDLERLVHHSGAINGDAFTHRPCRMLQRLLRSDLGKIGFAGAKKRASGCSENQACHFFNGAVSQASV